jgi:hypothetical protein
MYGLNDRGQQFQFRTRDLPETRRMRGYLHYRRLAGNGPAQLGQSPGLDGRLAG